MSRLVWLGLFTTFVVMAPIAIHLHAQAVQDQGLQRIGQGKVAPFYFLVQEFFAETVALQKMGDDWIEFNLFRPLGVKLDSPAATILVSGATQGYEETRGVLWLDENADPEAEQARQSEHLAHKIQKTAIAYELLLAELEEIGYDPATLDRFIYAEFGPNVAIFSSDGESEESGDFLTFVGTEFDRQRRATKEKLGGEP